VIEDEQKTKSDLLRELSTLRERVSELKQAEEALKHSEKHFKKLFENTRAGVYRTTPDGRIIMANPVLVQMLGYSSFEELTERNLEKEGFAPRYPYLMFKDLIEREVKIVGLESAWLRRDGTTLFITENARVVRDESGKTLYYEGIVQDITERKRLEDSLRESEDKYRTLIESASESIATINESGVFLFINKRGAKELGGKPEDYVGKTMWDLFPKEIADQQAASVREVINTEQEMNKVELTELQGQPRWYNTTLEPLRDGSGKVTAALVIARDIHTLKQAEEELEMYRERMARAEQLASLGTLSATVAHELTQPLTVIRLSIENALTKLEATSSPETVTRKLKDSLTEVSNITSIVERFRNFARRSSEEIVGEIDLKAVGERIVKLLNESARRARITLHLNSMDKLPPVYLNEKDMEQLFFALADNAIQAAGSKKSRQLIISGAVKNEHIELSFSDNCGGIAPEDIDKIFEPFFTTKPKGQGTGLGLCIVQSIVSRAGGKIRVESKFGEGATFFVTLPTNKYTRS